MCGIAGIISQGKNATRVDAIERCQRMLSLLKHRGPDDGGLVGVNLVSRSVRDLGSEAAISRSKSTAFDVALGHRRLSILDLSPAGHQPMPADENRIWITFNGEIYNYLELREELTSLGHTFQSGTDTEVILASWKEWGQACLDRFNGDWAFAILDLRSAPLLFLSRDRFGIKPLFYTRDENGFAFASEAKALVGISRAFVPHLHAVRRFLLSGELPPGSGADTFFEGIFQLPPGHSITLKGTDLEDFELDQWYDLASRTESAPAHRRPERIGTEMEEHLTRAVRFRLRADVPVGSCLSGGLDSSAVVGTIRSLLGEGSPVHSFSAVYDEKGPFNEREWIEAVVGASQATPHYVFPDRASLGEAFDRLVWHQDEPFQTASIFAQWCVMEKARKDGVTVLLDGQAADELLAGYQPGTFQEQFLEWLQRGQYRRFWHEWRARRRISGLSWRDALSELWQILLFGTTGVVHAKRDRIDPVERLNSLGFRSDQFSRLYSGKETDYEELRSALEEDLTKLTRWKARLGHEPDEREELEARIAKKQKQILSRRTKLARFRDRGSYWWRWSNDWRVICQRLSGKPSHSLRELLLAQTTMNNLQHLLRFEDRNSMAHSIEARVPFTDPPLVEWAFSHADDSQIRGGWTKWPLRIASLDTVPERIVWRRDKVGFETPDLEMTRRLLAEAPIQLHCSEFLLQFLEPSAVQSNVDAVRQGLASPDQAKLVWRWLVLESWHRQFSACPS